MSKYIEKFRLKEKCVHCQRNFNIYTYFSSDFSEHKISDVTFSLPLVLACGHKACEKCVKLDEKKGKCVACRDITINNEHEWETPYDLKLIHSYREKIKKTLTDSELKCWGRPSNFTKKIIETTKLEIQSGLLAISFKCTNRCSDAILSSYKTTIAKINELSEVRARNNDVDTMLKKLQLSKSIFESESKMEESLQADLSAMKELPPRLVASKFKNFALMELPKKLDAIITMIGNGVEVVVGHRIDEELWWAPVRFESPNLYVSSFSKTYKPADNAARIQYQWLQPKNELPDLLYIEITMTDDAIKISKIPTSVSKKFKLVIKVLDFGQMDKSTLNYSEFWSAHFGHLCSGENGYSLIGRKMVFSFKTAAILTMDKPYFGNYRPKMGKPTKIRNGTIYVTNHYEKVANFFIVVNKEAYDENPNGVFIGKVKSGLCYLHWMCDRAKSEHMKATVSKVTDCGLVFKPVVESNF